MPVTVKPMRFDALKTVPAVDIILAVAVEIERKEALACMTPLEGEPAVLKVPYDGQTYFVGRCGLYNVVLVKSEMGATGPSGAHEVVGHAIRTWNAHAVIAVGIAFGKSRGKGNNGQRLGDVLVSRMIIPYEHERVSEKSEIPRDPHPDAGPTLLNRFSNTSWTWKAKDRSKRAPQLGPILSGAKLVDQLKFKTKLFSKHPKAIGGEMEGVGIYGAAAANKVEWIIVKAICDWGFGKTGKPQPLAAKNACALVAHVLSEPGLALSDFSRGAHNRVPADAARRMDAAARSLTLSQISNQIREAHDDALRRTEKLIELMTGEASKRSKSSEKRKSKDVEAAKAALDASNERFLNAYNDAATRYLANDVDAAPFRASHAAEVRELFEKEGEFQRVLRERPEAYASLHRAYQEFSAPKPSATSSVDTNAQRAQPRSFLFSVVGNERYTTECLARQLVGALEPSERLVVLAPPGAPFDGLGLNRARLADLLGELDTRGALALPQFQGRQERLDAGVRRLDTGNIFALGRDGSIAIRRRLSHDRPGHGRVVARGDVGIFSSIEQILACVRLARIVCECTGTPLRPWWLLHELHGVASRHLMEDPVPPSRASGAWNQSEPCSEQNVVSNGAIALDDRDAEAVATLNDIATEIATSFGVHKQVREMRVANTLLGGK